MDEVVHEFLVESYENLDQLDRDLVALEQTPDSRPLLASVFRTIHTIKGTSGFLAFGKLEQITHVGEGLLSLLRDGEIELTPDITSVLLELVDAVRALLAAIEATGSEGDADHASLVTRLTAIHRAVRGGRTEEQPAAASDGAEPAREAVRHARRLGEKLVDEGIVHPDDVALAVLEQEVGDNRRIGEILVEHGAVDASTLNEVLGAHVDVRRSVTDSSVRVDVDLLDNLMRLVGELLLTRNQVAGAVVASGDIAMMQAWQRLNAITANLQEGVVKARMQPIESVWNKLPRMVRDLGVAMGKQVRIEQVGGDTELDRSVLEAVKDPLTHLVRNALDHGIEMPAARVANGKTPEGRLTLRAYHDGGQVVIEISDDGAGIDTERIAATAIEKGLLTKREVEHMSARDIVNCIFLPGFSTAERVTNVSGRGVGMDVVKTNMERIGGSVDVHTEVGTGTTFRVKLPLTLAIVSALIVASDGNRLAVPQANVVELVRLDQQHWRDEIESIGGALVYRLRGELLPLLSLRTVLGQPDGSHDERGAYIVVLGAQERRFGLVVDDVLDNEEIVVKPLSEQLKHIPAYAGATILGDGCVALIVDVWSIAAELNVGVVAGRAHRRGAEAETREQLASLLVVRIDEARLLAVPLENVTRLDEVPASQIERVGPREALQYRGSILPIVRLGELVSGQAPAAGELLQVVVYTENGRSVGLVVEEIIDIADESLDIVTDIDGPGISGTAVVSRQVMEMLDVRQAIAAADPHFYDVQTAATGS